MRTNDAIRLQWWISTFTLVLGAALMAFMVIAEGEPGLIPLLLVAAGGSGLVIARVRRRTRGRGADDRPAPTGLVAYVVDGGMPAGYTL